MKIKVDELCYVNGNLGTYDRETRTWTGTTGTVSDYIQEHNLGTLSEIIFEGRGKTEISFLKPEQVLEIDHAIGRMKIAKDQARALWENKVFRGDF